jgi:hypothetical protein
VIQAKTNRAGINTTDTEELMHIQRLTYGYMPVVTKKKEEVKVTEDDEQILSNGRKIPKKKKELKKFRKKI